MIGRRKPKGLGNVPELTREEVERRVGVRGDGLPAEPASEGEGLSPTSWDGAPAPVLRVASGQAVSIDRRRLLWRDSATILIGLVLVLLAFQVLAPGGIPGAPTGTASPEPSGVAIGSSLPQATLGPGETFGPIVDPSIGIDATPTPIPVITMGPSPAPGRSPAPPGPTPRPTSSPKPTPRPTPKPTPTPTGTPAPPVALFSWNQTGDLTFDFTNSSTGETGVSWDFGDGSAGSTASNPTHDFPSSGVYTVKLTVTGPGGTDTVSHTVDVEPLPTPTDP